MASPTHRFITWFPLAFPASVMAICSQWQKPKDWVGKQADWALGKMSEPSNVAMLFLLCVVVIAFWIWLFLKTAPKSTDHDFAGLAELVGQLRQPIASPISPLHAVIQVDDASHGQVSGPVVPAPLIGLYVGLIIASAGALHSQGILEIAIRGFNGTGSAVRVRGVKGRMRSGVGNLRDLYQLPPPAMVSEHTPDSIAGGAEFQILLNQNVGPEMVKTFLDAFDGGIQIDLRELNIEIEGLEDKSRIGRLPLWDALTLKRRDDVFTGRVTIASVGMATTSPESSLSMRITKADEAMRDRDV